MVDQAAELRNLVLQNARRTAQEAALAPRLIAFTGGQGGVGTTTLAVNIAVALVDQGLRVVLVDADLYRADVAALCHLPERGHVGDILSARRDIHEVLERGPGGVLIVPGIWAPENEVPYSQRSHLRLLKQVQSLGRHADIVLLDLGSAVADTVHRFWMAAHEVVLVTTPDDVSVMDCYATLKTAVAAGATDDTVRLIVNKTSGTAQAQDVYGRLHHSANRFLQRDIQWLGAVAIDPRMAQSATDGPPAVMAEPGIPAVRAIQQMAAELAHSPGFKAAAA